MAAGSVSKVSRKIAFAFAFANFRDFNTTLSSRTTFRTAVTFRLTLRLRCAFFTVRSVSSVSGLHTDFFDLSITRGFFFFGGDAGRIGMSG